MSTERIANETQPELASGDPSGVEPWSSPIPVGGGMSPIEAGIQGTIDALRKRGDAAKAELIAQEQAIGLDLPDIDWKRTFRARLPTSVKSFLTTSPWQGIGVKGPAPIHITGDPALEAKLERLKEELVTVGREMRNAATQLIIAHAIPIGVAQQNIETIEDVIDRFGDHINTPEDLVIAQRTLDWAINLKLKYQASTTKTPQEFLTALGSKRNITVYGLTTLRTTPDLLGFIEGLRVPQLPPGMTIDDMREVLGNAGISPATSFLFMQEVADFTISVNRDLDTLATRAAMWEADLINSIGAYPDTE